MHPAALILLAICSFSLAHYRGYGSKNLIVREEPSNEHFGNIVECPVCDDSGHWMPSNEECPIVLDDKRYKKCERGTYINEVCGNRRDCYRGPGEQCTEKHDLDIYGQKCAPGLYCNKPLGVCTGVGFAVDTLRQYIVNPTPYFPYSERQTGLKGRLPTNPFIRN